MTKNFSYDDEEFSANNKFGENKLIQNEEIDLKPK